MIRLTVILLLPLLLACGIGAPEPLDIEKTKKTYAIVTEKKPPHKVYYIGRWVRSPQPATANLKPRKSDKLIIPSFHFDFTKSNLCEVSVALSTSLRYSNYCSSILEKTFISLNRVLTPYELKDYIETETGIKVVIDSLNREVRFLARDPITPEYRYRN